MRIGIDAHILSGKPQGSRTYLIHLLLNLAKIDRENEYLVYGPSAEEMGALLAEAGDRFVYRPLHAGSSAGRLLLAFPRAAARDRLDLLYHQYISPPFARRRTAVTIHDVLFETMPQYFPRWFVARSRLLVRRSARRAAAVFTDSRFSRDALVARYGLDPARVHFAHLGVDHERFRPLSADALPPEIEAFRRHAPFLLFVGRLDPRKNLPGLIEALALRKQRKRLRERLLVAGQPDYRHASVFEAIERHGLREHVVFLGPVEDRLLPALYNAAEAFVYPSFGEGFGLPVVEAMACGVPVVTTDAGSLAEVAGDAAERVDPHSAESIEAGIERVVNDPALRRDLRARGLERAQRFRWDRCAAVVYEAWRQVARA